MNIDTAALGGSNTSRLAPAVGKPQSLQKWKHQVKIMTTRITVIRRFGRKYSTKSLQCSIAPGLTAGTSQLISQVQELIEKSNSTEGSAKKNQPAGRLFSTVSSSVPTAGAQFSPQGATSHDAPHQKVKRIPTLDSKNGEGFFTDHRALAPALQILLVLVVVQILKEADLLDASTAGLVVIVTVIVLPPGTEGTTATNDRIMRVNICTRLALFLFLSNFVIKGVHGQNESEDGEPEHPNQLDKLPYNVKAAAGTFLAGLMMIAVVVAGNINRRRLVTGTQATGSADPTVPVPAGAPQALPPLVGTLPVVPALAAAPPAAIVPVPAAAPHALPAPVGALLAVPALAAAPPAAIVPVPAAAPHALPALVGALLAVPALAAAPPAAIVPVPAAAPNALPAPVGALPAVPALAAAPPAAIVPVPAAAPNALPAPVGALPAVPALAAAPPVAIVPVPALAGQGFDIMDGLSYNLDARSLVIYDQV